METFDWVETNGNVTQYKATPRRSGRVTGTTQTDVKPTGYHAGKALATTSGDKLDAVMSGKEKVEYVVTKMDDLANWARKGSMVSAALGGTPRVSKH